MAEIFEHAVAYVSSLRNFQAVEQAARAGGVVGLAIKTWDTGVDPDVVDNLARLRSGEVRRLRGLGFVPGMWPIPRTEPERCVAETSALLGEVGLSFCVFETEWEYKTDGGGIDVGRLLRPWRQVRPKTYTAVATEGMVPETFNHTAAITAGCRYLPESYWHLGERYDPRAEMIRAKALGWPLARVHPTASGVEGHDFGEALIRCYRARTAGFTRGIALWRGDMLNAAQYRLLGLTAGDLSR